MIKYKLSSTFECYTNFMVKDIPFDFLLIFLLRGGSILKVKI